MKTTLKIIALSTLGFTTLSYANEPQETSLLTDMFSKSHFDKDFSASIGLRLWENKWNLPRSVTSGNYYDENVLNTIATNSISDNKFSSIPSVGIRYKNFFLGGSYFTNTDYDFKTQNLPDVWRGSYWAKTNVKVLAKRTEWDITSGYYLNKYLMLTLGYKNINRKYTECFGVNVITYPDDPCNMSSVTYTNDSKAKGLIFGLGASAPLGNSGFNLYGNLSYGKLRTEQLAISNLPSNSPKNANYKNNYYLGEFGISYAIPFKDNYFSAISMSLGYRFQRYEFDHLSNNTFMATPLQQTAVDTTDGFVAGINILF